MSYGETKVYFDGSHYIAIPHTTRPIRQKRKLIEEVITVVQDDEITDSETEPFISHEVEQVKTNEKLQEKISEIVESKPKKVKQLTKKEFFNELYSKYIDLSRKKREKEITREMMGYFDEPYKCEIFVKTNMERKMRNLICRRIRMIRKANLVDFNYFCTFTYDDVLHTEESFKKKLKIALMHNSSRKGWKYIGVWERAPKTKRLHFHGLFHIPNGTMPGVLEEHSDYNFSSHRRTKTMQNTYFNNRFGRSDFQPIGSNRDLMQEIQYICKYLEKTEEKIVYSKGLYQYFISDIMDDDVVCTIGQEEKKLLLFDDFKCWDEGCLVGQVSPEVINQMRKCN